MTTINNDIDPIDAKLFDLAKAYIELGGSRQALLDTIHAAINDAHPPTLIDGQYPVTDEGLYLH